MAMQDGLGQDNTLVVLAHLDSILENNQPQKRVPRINYCPNKELSLESKEPASRSSLSSLSSTNLGRTCLSMCVSECSHGECE